MNTEQALKQRGSNACELCENPHDDSSSPVIYLDSKDAVLEVSDIVILTKFVKKTVKD